MIGRRFLLYKATHDLFLSSRVVIMAIADDAQSIIRSSLQTEPKLMEILCYVFIVWASLLVWSLRYMNAPYGRYSRSGFGFQVPAKVAWFIQELPSVVVPIYLVVFTECPRAGEWKNRIALGLYFLHYLQRTFIFPFLIKGGKPTPMIPFAVAIVFCLLNGYLQGRHLLTYADLHHNVSQVQFFTGLLIFITGMCINIHSDHILRNLRKKGEEGYKIPYGGMFEYVSGANFLGEVIEWWGYAVMCGTLPALVFAYFTLCNVGPRACHHHRWYHEKFEDYPKNRKAFIPFLL